jgi:hypothetical protein
VAAPVFGRPEAPSVPEYHAFDRSIVGEQITTSLRAASPWCLGEPDLERPTLKVQGRCTGIRSPTDKNVLGAIAVASITSLMS